MHKPTMSLLVLTWTMLQAPLLRPMFLGITMAGAALI
jgi:hypothetical protein